MRHAGVRGRGDDLMSCFDATETAKDKWPSLLSRDTLCGAEVHGKGDDLISFCKATETASD